MHDISRQRGIAGIYITDDYVDVGVGIANLSSNNGANGLFECSITSGKTFVFREYGNEGAGDEIGNTFDAIAKWIADKGKSVVNVGVGCFGPFRTLNPNLNEIEKSAQGYGHITSSVHSDFENRNIYTLIKNGFEKIQIRNLKIQIQTDVEVAALGELYSRHVRNGQWVDDGENQVIAFLKFSKGIGGGIVYGNRLWAGRLHTEMGQIRVERWPGFDEESRIAEMKMKGVCKFHGDCLEGLASVTSFFARWKRDFVKLIQEPDHPAWDREAFYAAQLCLAVTCLFAPSRIILGGRIMKAPNMVRKTRKAFNRFLGIERSNGANPGYSDAQRSDFLDGYAINPTGYGSGLVGTLVLASIMSKKPTDVASIMNRF